MHINPHHSKVWRRVLFSYRAVDVRSKKYLELDGGGGGLGEAP